MSSDALNAITVEGLSKRYVLGETVSGGLLTEKLGAALMPWRRAPKAERAEFWALRDVSLHVAEGEVVGIIGRNGAGKSTLLKILSQVTRPTEGRAELRGRVGSLLEVGTGFHPELTGRENVFLNGAILGMGRLEISSKYEEIVDFAGVSRFMETPVKRYSSGMLVRLAFAVAAHLEPEILIVDEVLAVGDAEFQRKCLAKLGAVSREGKTVLFVSHNLSAVRDMCDRAYLLRDGRVVTGGGTDDVLAAYLKDVGSVQSGGVAIIAPDAERDGSGEARFTKVELLDGSGEPADELMLGAPITVRLSLELDKPRERLAFELGVVTVDGTRAATSHNIDFGRAPLALDGGAHIVTSELDLPLLPGDYALDVAVHTTEGGGTLDSVAHVLDFAVLNVSNIRGDRWPWVQVRGFVRPPSNWTRDT